MRLTMAEYREVFEGTLFRDLARGVTHSRIRLVEELKGHSGLDRFRPPWGVMPYVLCGF